MSAHDSISIVISWDRQSQRWGTDCHPNLYPDLLLITVQFVYTEGHGDTGVVAYLHSFR